jgi:hypothetical protein
MAAGLAGYVKEVEIRMTPEGFGQSREDKRALFRRMVLSHFDLQETRRFLDRLQPMLDGAEAGQDDETLPPSRLVVNPKVALVNE